MVLSGICISLRFTSPATPGFDSPDPTRSGYSVSMIRCIATAARTAVLRQAHRPGSVAFAAALLLLTGSIAGQSPTTGGVPPEQHEPSTLPNEGHFPEDDGDLEPRRPADFDERLFNGGAVPLVIESLGMAMYRPGEAEVRVERHPGHVIAHIRDRSPIPAWTMSFQHLIVDQPITAEQQLGTHVNQIIQAGHDIEIITNTPYEVGDIEGYYALIKHMPPDGEPYINGWLLLPVDEQMFLVASLLTMPDDLPRVRPMLEACFDTLRVRSADQLAKQRLTRLGMGQAFLKGISSDDLRDLVGKQQWLRMYKRSDGRDDSETEVGYALLEVVEAPRGRLNPERAEEHYTPDEQENGMLVRIQGRILGDVDRGLFYDSLALYWMAWDQSTEAWSVLATQRQGEAARTETETGLRDAISATNPAPRLQVIRTRSADYSREPSEWSVPDVYMSQVTGTVLGFLLPTDKQRTLELSYYYYVYAHGAPTLTQRLDRWEPDEQGRDRWVLTTRMTPDSRPIRSTYRADGTLIRREHPDGTIAVPIEYSDLRRLWERKGLPLSDTARRR